jgi:excisionase family DNA binding protein
MDEFLTIQEAIKTLKVARATLYRWINEGKIQAYKFGNTKRTYLKRGELEAQFKPVQIGESPKTEGITVTVAA